jgi:hypothetical protein
MQHANDAASGGGECERPRVIFGIARVHDNRQAKTLRQVELGSEHLALRLAR